MLRALVFMLFATAAVSASAAGRTGDSRFLVKAWVQKFDNSFEHVTGWCDGNDLCTLELAGHELRLNFSLPETAIASASTPILTLPPPCCVFADGTEEAFIGDGTPHAEILYYRLPAQLADKGPVEFGTLYIALEDLR
ncbi:hypothetical protein [Sinorhizobium meliloti]|uniref:hypothetical protein n=1 Tax=Rhizobium meliloti TaxID=382 RepID=UPI001F35E899|nr:hypothetical protein [Sinorhizobium meliloti]